MKLLLILTLFFCALFLISCKQEIKRSNQDFGEVYSQSLTKLEYLVYEFYKISSCHSNKPRLDLYPQRTWYSRYFLLSYPEYIEEKNSFELYFQMSNQPEPEDLELMKELKSYSTKKLEKFVKEEYTELSHWVLGYESMPEIDSGLICEIFKKITIQNSWGKCKELQKKFHLKLSVSYSDSLNYIIELDKKGKILLQEPKVRTVTL